MPDKQHSYIIPDEQSVAQLVTLLQEAFPLERKADTVFHRVFYDTFDWRLYKNGSALEMHDDGSSPKIYWRADRDGQLKIQLGPGKVPALAAELADSDFRRQLQSVISVRELLPRIKLRINRQSFAVLDDHKKIVVRLYFDVYWFQPSKLRAARVLAKRLTIKAVKGYADDYQRVEDFLLSKPETGANIEGSPGDSLGDSPGDSSGEHHGDHPATQLLPLHSAQDNMMKLALIARGEKTDDYTTRLYMRIDPKRSAQQVLKEIMRQLLKIMQQNTAGCIKGRDTEYMHDYRVAIRKIRVALKQFSQLNLQAAGADYKQFFSELGRLSNPVRDIDVFLQHLESCRDQVDEAGWQQLQPLCEYLSSTRAEAQKRLSQHLKSPGYRENIKRLRVFLEHETTDSNTDDSEDAVFRLADEKLWKITRRVVEQGKAITAASDADTLHDFRKTFKQLRYLMEFFRGLYPAVELRESVNNLADVQDNLGTFNDRHIQMAMVAEFIDQSEDQDAIKASEKMITILKKQQREAGRHFKENYSAYASARSQKRFKEMFVEYYGGKVS